MGSRDISQVLADGLKIVSTHWLPLMVALAGVGVLSMAIIQAVKDLVPIHRWFNRARVLAWLGAKTDDELKSLFELATGNEAQALYDLPIARLMAQISIAGRGALAFADDYEDLLRRLSASSDPREIAQLGSLVRKLRDGEALSSSESVELEGLKTRVGQRIERSIDGQQIAMSARWEFWNKVASFVVSGAVTIVALNALATLRAASSNDTRWLTVTMLPFVIFAGFVAPVAKDLVTALESIRKR